MTQTIYSVTVKFGAGEPQTFKSHESYLAVWDKIYQYRNKNVPEAAITVISTWDKTYPVEV